MYWEVRVSSGVDGRLRVLGLGLCDTAGVGYRRSGPVFAVVVLAVDVQFESRGQNP